MALYLGIDTSNYTTSVALFDPQAKNVIQKKKLLPVKPGEKGVRQSDAVFHHTMQIRELLPELIRGSDISAVCVSVRPRSVEGSYMPCFAVGYTVAASVAAALGVPLYEVSHQEGHITAALFSAGRLDLAGKDFYAFHISGGTTELLKVAAGERCPLTCEIIGASSDLHAGQAVDRVGLMLGLDFPCGPELEKLAFLSSADFPEIRASMNGADCSLSGVENKCGKMLDEGAAKEDIALYCLRYIEKSILGMQAALPDDGLPVVYSGGVMSNGILQKEIAEQTNRETFFAAPEFSSDNAAGVAILGYLIGDKND